MGKTCMMSQSKITYGTFDFFGLPPRSDPEYTLLYGGAPVYRGDTSGAGGLSEGAVWTDEVAVCRALLDDDAVLSDESKRLMLLGADLRR